MLRVLEWGWCPITGYFHLYSSRVSDSILIAILQSLLIFFLFFHITQAWDFGTSPKMLVVTLHHSSFW